MKKISVIVFVMLVGCAQQIDLQNPLQKELSLNYADKKLNDTRFYAFQQKCTKEIEKINQNHDDQKKEWMKTLTAEGEQYFILNWKFLKEKYGKYLSKAYNDWLIHLDQTEKIVDDAALRIDHDQLRVYLIELENFIDKNPDFIAIKEVKARLNWYLMIYLSGLDNSPIYDKYGNLFMLQDVKLSYEKFLSENSSSKYLPLVKKLYETAKKYNFKWNTQIEKWFSEFYQKNLASLLK